MALKIPLLSHVSFVLTSAFQRDQIYFVAQISFGRDSIRMCEVFLLVLHRRRVDPVILGDGEEINVLCLKSQEEQTGTNQQLKPQHAFDFGKYCHSVLDA